MVCQAPKIFVLQSFMMIVLSFGAHPDDVDFGYAGSLAKWVKQGATAYVVICTLGNRGSRDHPVDQHKLVEERRQEQQQSSKIVGVKKVIFLDHEDGNLVIDLPFKEELVKIIRRYKPDKVLTHDPSWYYRIREDFAMINHHDHRATGEAVLDAVYPLSRDLASFPDHQKMGLKPHQVNEVYMPNFDNPNYFEDITDTLEIKIKAILAHKSQVDDPKKTKQWVRERAEKLGQKAGFKYAEGFTKLVLR